MKTTPKHEVPINQSRIGLQPKQMRCSRNHLGAFDKTTNYAVNMYTATSQNNQTKRS